MEVLYLTKYSRKGASSRLRSYQYFPYLIRKGINVSVSPLFGDRYLETLYSGRKSYISLIKGYSNRFIKLLGICKYDLIVIEYELFPYFPAWAEWTLSSLNIKYIVDYDDAIFHNYDMHTNKWVRLLLGRKIDFVMRHSTCVIAGNEYLASRANQAGAPLVKVIPTVIDTEAYSRAPNSDNTNTGKVTIGWIGSPSTFKYVSNIKSVLEEIVSYHDIEIHIIGVSGGLDFIEGVKYIPWSESTEIASIASLDIGIMPLEDNLWEKGKCSYKLIQYMGCGLPVVASPVGMNRRVVMDGINGFWATTNEDWVTALNSYINNFELRRTHGRNGKNIVKSNYSMAAWKNTILEIIIKSAQHDA